MATTPSANQQVADAVTTHSVNLLRIEASLRDDVLAELKRLEGQLIAEVAQLPEDTTAFKAARLNALLKQTQDSIVNAYALIAEAQGEALKNITATEQQKTNQILDNTFSVDVATTAMTPDQIEAAIGDQLLAGRFHEDWWDKQSDDLRGKFSATMRDGMAKGEGVDALVRRVRGTQAAGFNDGIMEISRRQAEALVRTSVQSAANTARIQSFLANTDIIKAIQWRSTLDSRTTVICIGLDGLQWTLPSFTPVGHDKPFPGPTAHWNCRSVQVPVLKSFAELSKKGAVRPPAAPKASLDKLLTDSLTEKGMSDTQIAAALRESRITFDGEAAPAETFDDFLRRKGVDYQNQLLGPQRAALWRSGRITLRQLTDQTARPLTVEQLQKMVDKNVAMQIDAPVEGQNGLGLLERRLLSESLAAGLPRTGAPDVLTSYMDAATGEVHSINGMSPTEGDLAAIKGFSRLTILRNGLSNNESFTPQEIGLFGKLPNFESAKIVTPNGRVTSFTQRPGLPFDSAAAKAVNKTAVSLEKTISTDATRLVAAARDQGFLNAQRTTTNVIAPLRAGELVAQPTPKVPGALSFDSQRAIIESLPSNASIQQVSEALHANALKARVSVTNVVKDVANTAVGEPIGLEFADKKVDSLARKIQTDMDVGNISQATAAARIGDTLRYTIQFEPSNYHDGVMTAIAGFEERGFTLIKYKNLWDKLTYKGINTTMQTPEGLFMEVQYHTPESFEIKEYVSHVPYEEWRLSSTPKARSLELEAEMAEYWSPAVIPDGAMAITPPEGFAPLNDAWITSANIEQWRFGVNTDALAKYRNRISLLFDQPANTKVVPLSKLVSTKNELSDRAFLAGMKDDPRQNAVDHMLAAAKGSEGRRAPLSVAANPDGTYTIIDGNATVQALMLAGWTEVPVIVSGTP